MLLLSSVKAFRDSTGARACVYICLVCARACVCVYTLKEGVQGLRTEVTGLAGPLSPTVNTKGEGGGGYSWSGPVTANETSSEVAQLS